MTIKSILLASTAVLALSATAFAAEKTTYESTVKVEKDTVGNYSEKESIKKKLADGTTNSSEKKLTVEVDSKGNTDKTRTAEVITDPKGLGNKHVVKTKDTEKTKDGEVTVSHEKTINGKNVEGTTDHYKSSSKVTSDADGNYAEKDITVSTDDEGTSSTYEKKATVDVDANGNVEKSTTTKEVTDPKGLMNKSTVKTSNTESTKDGLIKSDQKVTVDGKTIESKSTTSPAR